MRPLRSFLLADNPPSKNVTKLKMNGINSCEVFVEYIDSPLHTISET